MSKRMYDDSFRNMAVDLSHTRGLLDSRIKLPKKT